MVRHFFFYGTLRPGQRNHAVFLDGRPGVIHVGGGLTVERFSMLAAGFPYVLREPARDRIRGDVFLIRSARAVRALDALEGHTGRAEGYRREIVPVRMDQRVQIPCWTYIHYGSPLAEPVPGGDWLSRPGG
ncbi:hypothetical protein NNJEOMEG_03679 [Fundidesulfovibrio magnetotacticus]|uniref:Gamma-glutamylcyclotransferase family protein n=1 Tax=Fundidesulfovibrio magnetotacticus TaxID=2730080 RepID=A0A6V8LZ41_9BACT|nr:hypothetical protein NNJEOMEG_03679 [Fundidesulfovibrio magnetotacticus]